MKRKTLRKHKDFIAPKNVLLARSGAFWVKALPTKTPDDARYGLVVSKKSFKLAVQRNRAKRLIRDWIAFNQDLMLPQLDYIFFMNIEILEYNREHGRDDVKHALKRISKLYKKQDNDK